jgi:hypothetical protein
MDIQQFIVFLEGARKPFQMFKSFCGVVFEICFQDVADILEVVLEVHRGGISE